MKQSQQAAGILAEKLLYWRDNPDRFVIEVIGAEPDPWQVVALRGLYENNRVSIAACHGPGKDAVAAWAILWVMMCFPHPKIPCTAPTSHQLYDLLWAELAKWLGKMPKFFRDLFELKRDRFERKGSSETWFAAARTARRENSEALQGFHADTILVVTDEASGVDSLIFEVLEGAMTGPKAMWLCIGNPTQSNGYFYETHHADRARWHTMRVMAASAHDGGPLGDSVFLSERVSPDYVHAMRSKYGEDSNVYRVRVLGQFPRSDDDQAIPLEWVEKAAMRNPLVDMRSGISIGVDVARFGSDDSAVVVREGTRVLDIAAWNGHDISHTTGKVVALAKKWTSWMKERTDKEKRYSSEEKLAIFVDVIGVGAGVADSLKYYVQENKVPWTIVEVDAGAKSPDDKCSRMRDYLWWKAREFFQEQEASFATTIPRDMRDQLIGELACPKYFFTPTGSIKVESKDELKKRGIPSPNIADAFIHTFKFDVMRPKSYQADGWRERQSAQGSGWEWS